MTVTYGWMKEVKAQTRSRIKKEHRHDKPHAREPLAEDLTKLHFELGIEVDPGNSKHQFVLDAIGRTGDEEVSKVSLKGKDAMRAVRAGADVQKINPEEHTHTKPTQQRGR